ncbi:L-fucose:H+ symporter permease [Staphylococcus xylosus]|uniref:L-fucose:H+ symporter permease n=1 Tax=Staphylococcus pseudoxylosus TaxID=2282419 RepID=UPI000D1D1B4F|nr:L-fucose:H+ symporter permease [Staphylococcus pseudoxylosus]PTI46250.1 L-fucose:H+ symporter permease [Staphylococcus xylosus]MDW8797380.1 L-fucose:H+ symporter permease [Staphylococcus pseudoxylosus]MEB6036406.1 L-fucose:H+ symporter permease [Staphylococcus pseudoxylosus]MEB6044513.1 L-fucose:H+ symporter permease [Staphylococcus pseudoxylosus]MEB6061164.1 L-fucose:H+ symporter permease [Staphylococcus pseudoxylosus]
MSKDTVETKRDGFLNKMPILQYILVTLLFPLWGAAASLNDVLIAQFKTIFDLSNFASAFVQSAFYGGYFIFALPAALLVKKTSYRLTIVTGLLLYIIGCALFFPASHMATYGMFLAALFIIAIGLSCLETSANTYSLLLGPKEKATQRINLSQTFYPIGAMIGAVLGKYFIFTNGGSLEKQMSVMNSKEATQFGLEMLQRTMTPYIILIVVLIAVMILFIVIKFPECKPEEVENESDSNIGFKEAIQHLSKNKGFRKGVLTQFIYMGLQTTVWSFTLRLALDVNPHINERFATNFVIFSFIAFFIGRFIATSLLSKFDANKILMIYSAIGVIVLLYASLIPNTSAIYAAVFVSVLFGPCWPTIYGKTIEKVTNSKYIEFAGAILIMSIIGGAVMPVIQGLAADIFGSMQLSFIVPMLCFAYIAIYFYSEKNK